MTATAPAPAAYTIGVADAPQLADALRDLNFDVVDVAVETLEPELMSAGASRGPFPVVVAAPLGGIPADPSAFLARITGQVSVAILHATDDDLATHPLADAQHLVRPVTLNAVLSALGYQQLGDARGSALLDPYVPPAPEPVALPLPKALPTPLPAPLPTPMPAAFPAPARAEPTPAPEPTASIPAFAPAPSSPTTAPAYAPAPAAAPAPAPSYMPPAPAPVLAPPAPTVHEDDLFASAMPATSRSPLRPAGAEALRETTTMIVSAGKGGVTKTTLSLLLASLASDVLGPDARVLYIDGNRGQGDTQVLLKVPAGAIPTVYDMAHTRPADVVSTPSQVNAARGVWGKNRPIGFHYVPAPPRGFGGADRTPATSYRDLLNWAQSRFDLVVIDTQMLEDSLTDLERDVWIPEYQRRGAWLIALTDESRMGFAGLQRILDAYTIGSDSSRAVFVNALQSPETEFTDEHERQWLQVLAGKADHFGGTTAEDPSFEGLLNAGAFDPHHPAVYATVANLLHLATGRAEFEVPDTDDTEQDGAGSGGGLFRRLFGRR